MMRDRGTKLLRGVAAALSCALAAGLGCSAKRSAPPGAPTSGARASTARSDEDGGALPKGSDAAQYDVTIDSSKGFLCGYDNSDMLQLDGSADQPEPAIATDEKGFVLLYHDASGALFIEAVPVDGAAQSPVPIIAPADAPAGVGVSVSGSHFLLGWRDQDSSAQTLRVRELSSVDHQPVALTSALVPTATDGELWASVGLADGFLGAFVEHTDAGSELRLQRLAADGTLLNALTVPGVGARKLEDLHLSRLDSTRALLAWLERDAMGMGQIMAMPVATDLTSKGQGQALALSKSSVHDSRFDLDARALSAGLLYHSLDGDVRDALKYRRIDASGTASQPELNIVNAPGRVRDGSIAAFGQGYAVAYRELPSLGVDHPAIDVAFINQFGAVVYQAELSQTSETGGRTDLAATADGHLLVGWTEQLPAGATTHALKLYCPGALVLCGGKVN
ncbi:MAG: hypothetical protein ACHQ53_14215 [Polyangiales bacterium]